MSSTNKSLPYGGLIRRFTAWLADALIVAALISLFRFAFFFACAQVHLAYAPGKAAMVSLAIGVAIAILYHTFFESSKLQATPGKLIFALTITDRLGRRISRQRALARHLSKYASAFSLGIGYLMYFTSKQKQCLHDQMAGCLIVQKQQPGRAYTPPGGSF